MKPGKQLWTTDCTLYINFPQEVIEVLFEFFFSISMLKCKYLDLLVRIHELSVEMKRNQEVGLGKWEWPDTLEGHHSVKVQLSLIFGLSLLHSVSITFESTSNAYWTSAGVGYHAKRPQIHYRSYLIACFLVQYYLISFMWVRSFRLCFSLRCDQN